MLRKVVKLAVLALVLHALYRSAPVFVHHYQFSDAVREAALFSRDRSEAEILQRVLELASRHEIPLDADAVQVRRDSQSTFIDASYEQEIEWLPSYRRPWPFTVSVEGWAVSGGAGRR